jgi:phospholipid-binding lipoprotein MlaA
MAVPSSSCRIRVVVLAFCAVPVLAAALLLAAPAQSADDGERPILPGLRFASGLDRAADAAVPEAAASPDSVRDGAPADSPPLYERIGDALAQAADGAGAALRPLVDKAAELAGRVSALSREGGAVPEAASPDSVRDGAPADSLPLYERIGDALTQAADGAGAALRPLVDKAAELAGRVSAPSLDDGATLARDVVTRVQRGVLEPLQETYVAGPGEDPAEDDARPLAVLAAAPAMSDALRAQYDDALRAAIATDDPLEQFNRVMFALNDGLRQSALYPVTSFYLRVTTPPFQQGVRNFFANLREPVTVASSLLEGQFADAGIAAARFGINSTVGIVGVLDPASRMGFPTNPRDIEEALCVYGLPSGPYLVLPIFGPGTVRDAAGRISTLIAYYEAMGSTIYVPYRLTDIAIRSIDVQKQLDRLNGTSLDPYIAQRVFILSTRALDCGRQSAVASEYFHK